LRPSWLVPYHPDMNKKLYNSLKRGLEESIAIQRGELAAGRIITISHRDKKSTTAPATPSTYKVKQKISLRPPRS